MSGRYFEFQFCDRLPPGVDGPPLLIAVNGQRVLSDKGGNQVLFLPESLPPAPQQAAHLLGLLNGQPCYAVEYPLDPVRGTEWRGLRSLLGVVEEPLFQLAGRACQIVQWARQHRFCGICGRATESAEADRSRRCEHCQENFYPRLSPCIIVVIRRENHCLLASSSRWEGRFYSALAGFIEPGETAEQALHREVMEEVGIRVANLEYFASQPWPFPGQLMLGFHADYLSGEIEVDGEEIIAADWWHYRNLPPHPDENTLSGRLIRQFVTGCEQQGRRE